MDIRVWPAGLWIVAFWACSSTSGSPAAPAVTPAAAPGSAVAAPLSPGSTWGTTGARLTVNERSVAIEFDCAHAGIDSLPSFDAKGRFEVAGYYVQEHGGPVRADETAIRDPATIVAGRDGTRLTLTVRVPGRKLVLGPFVLEEHAAGRLHKCL